LWVRAFPKRPSVAPLPADTFKYVDEPTTVRAPHNMSIRDLLFGPSVVTLLSRKLSKPTHVQPKAPSANRSIEIESTLEFTDPIPTSTITRRPVMPISLTNLADRLHFKLPGHVEDDVAAHLERGWFVYVSVVIDRNPDRSQRARLGPFKFEFESPIPVIPIGTASTHTPVPVHIYSIAADPLVPMHYAATWSDEPWRNEAREPGSALISFNRPIRANSDLSNELSRRLSVPPLAGSRLTRGEIRLETGTRVHLDLAKPAKSIDLPSARSRGSPSDLFMCVLLGLTPLLYTPESWFLLWIGARMRQRAKEARKVFRIRLWPLYAIGVAVFWMITLEGGARIAALVPAVVGLIQLLLPVVDSEVSPIRVHFPSKKK
jgi:hypothetical protein